MQSRKAPLLERILVVIIAYTLVCAALCIYRYLVDVYETHWPRNAPSQLGVEGWPVACLYHALWEPMGPQPAPGHPQTYQSHTFFTLPAGDLETLFLLSQDRHASVVLHTAQSAGATTADIQVQVQAFYEEEEALRPETRTICALRRSRGQYAIGVFVSAARFLLLLSPACMRRCLLTLGLQAAPGRQDGARHDVTLDITVWLPGPRSGTDGDFRVSPWLEPDLGLPQLRHVIGDPSQHAFRQASIPLTHPPIEVFTIPIVLDNPRGSFIWAPLQVIPAEGLQVIPPNPDIRGKFNVSSPSLAAPAKPISAGVSPFTKNKDLPFGVVLSTQIVERISLQASTHDSESGGGFFHADAHSPNSHPLGTTFSENTPGLARDLGLGSVSAISDTDLHAPYKGSFALLTASLQPPANAKPGVEDPEGQSHTRRVTSRIVGRGVCLVREIE
ncbi:hypothetical protein BC826DRAFT_1046067 [Russula brevipes]|nr:hypothetical protein BC826DRAFT_1046067 [Russula brevipes]